jgi:uncharacterized membrane protein YphA (DoxX/SURF4 family)
MEESISRLKRIKILQIFTISIRYLLGTSFVWASILKIQGRRFTPQSAEHEPISSLNHLFESMYQSGHYWHFIGWGQLLAGFLLMSQRFSTLGAVVFFPIMLNIFIITISFNWVGVLTITLLMLLINIYLLLWDWNKLKFIALPNPQNYIDNNAEFSKRKVWTYVGFFFFFFVVLIRKMMISKQLTDSFPINYVLVGAILMILIWAITLISQLIKK